LQVERSVALINVKLITIDSMEIAFTVKRYVRVQEASIRLRASVEELHQK